MKWPWSARVDEAQERATDARHRLDRVRDQWPAVRTAVGQSREDGMRLNEDHLVRLFREGRRGAT